MGIYSTSWKYQLFYVLYYNHTVWSVISICLNPIVLALLCNLLASPILLEICPQLYPVMFETKNYCPFLYPSPPPNVSDECKGTP